MGCFITFEGIEGCGKTTQIRHLAKRMEQLEIPVTVTREPGGCPIADQVRSILLNSANREMLPMTELLLYAAARSQHVEEVVKPALAAGKIVLCDRFTDATMAYQGYGRGIDSALIERLNQMATSGIRPDLTVILDCPVEVGLSRAFERINGTTGEREERFEMETVAFHQRVRDGYLHLARKEPDRFLVINGEENVDAVSKNMEREVLARIGGR